MKNLHPAQPFQNCDFTRHQSYKQMEGPTSQHSQHQVQHENLQHPHQSSGKAESKHQLQHQHYIRANSGHQLQHQHLHKGKFRTSTPTSTRT